MQGSTAKIMYPGQEPILVSKEQIPLIVEMLKDVAHKLNSTLDIVNDEDKDYGNIAMG